MIDKKFKSAEMQKKLSEHVIENYNKRKDRPILEKQWSCYYDLYRGINTKGSYKGRADLDWASAFLAIEILTPRIFNALFPRVKWFDIVGVEQSDEKQAQIMAAYLRQILEKDVHFRRKMIPLTRYCGIFGTMIGKTPYRYETKKVPKKTVKTISNLYGMFVPEYTNEETVVFDSIDLEAVDIYDFYPADDFIDNIEDQPFVIHKTFEYVDLLKKKKYRREDDTGIYENLDKIDTENSVKRATENKYKNMRKATLGLTSRNESKVLDSIDLLEYQGVFEGEDIIAIVANDGANNPVLSAEPMNTPDGQKTFVMGKWIDVPGEFWGMSAIERIEKSIYELNDRVNQTMDTTSQIINPMWLNSDADIVEGTLRIFPGRVINTSTAEGLRPLHPPVEILAPAYNSINTLITMMQDVSGATRFLGGSAQTPELQRTELALCLSSKRQMLGLILSSRELKIAL